MRRPMTTTTYYVGGAPIPDGAQVTVSIPQGARILEVRAIEGAPVLLFLADRDAATAETFAQWAHRAEEEALQ